MGLNQTHCDLTFIIFLSLGMEETKNGENKRRHCFIVVY